MSKGNKKKIKGKDIEKGLVIAEAVLQGLKIVVKAMSK